MKPMTSRNIAVIGGGISGLTTALRLVEQGNAVTLIEGSGQLGGLGMDVGYEEPWAPEDSSGLVLLFPLLRLHAYRP